MALAATTILEVRTGGSDTLNGGMFDPGQTAGMFTDGAATSATGNSPVFSSASYNFVAGDVGAWVYIVSGTSWTPGWYQIASVASNVATLTATIGTAFLSISSKPVTPNTVAGCATTSSPTGATWTIDYSQQDAAEIAYTDLASVGAGLLVSSVANPFGKQQVGNAIVITGGTNFTAGIYVIASVSVGLVATVVGPGNITTGAGVNGTGGLGGGLASPGMSASVKVLGNVVLIKYNATDYTIASATPNIATGIVNITASGSDTVQDYWIGYDTNRTIKNTDANRPTFKVAASGVTSVSVFKVAAASTVANYLVRNIRIDGQLKSAIRGFDAATGNAGQVFDRCDAINCTNGGFYGTSGVSIICLRCYANGCSTVAAFHPGNAKMILVNCVATGNTVTGFYGSTSSPVTCIRCLSYANTGGSSDGFELGAGNVGAHYVNCIAYGNGRDGFRFTTANARGLINVNNIAVANAVYGFNNSGGSPVASFNCAGGIPNTSGNENAITQSFGFVTLTTDPFTNAAAGDFSLNNAAGGGALLRAAGFPGVFPGGLTTGYVDIGAVQHQDSGGSTPANPLSLVLTAPSSY